MPTTGTYVIMANDFPDCVVVGTEAFADTQALRRKQEYVNRNCGYGANATGAHVERARKELSERMHWRAVAVATVMEGE